MSSFSLYLAGNIQKKHEKESQIFWTQMDQDLLQKALAPFKITFLNPATRSDDLSDQKSVFGRDLTQVTLADAIVVDVRERRGLGVGAEIMWAKLRQIPVISLAPYNSHYRKDKGHLLGRDVENWVHPFVECLSDTLVSTVEEAGEWIKRYFTKPHPPKDKDSIFEAIDHYLNTQLENDLPMQELIESNISLKRKLEQLLFMSTSC